MAWRRLRCFLEQVTVRHHRQEDRVDLSNARVDTTTDTLKFSDLPPELWILIASMLPTQSVACLSLCNRALSQILGPNIWRCLKLDTPGTRASFLADLSRDLPQYYVCYRCDQLHASNVVQWPRNAPAHYRTASTNITRCLYEDLYYKPCSESELFLRFPHVQLAMKRHQLGISHGLPLEAFQATEISYNRRYKNIVLLSIDAEIISNEFLLRSQQWLLLPRHRRNELVDKRPDDSLCDHIRCWGDPGYTLQDLVKIRLDLCEAGQCNTSTAQCLDCPTDFVLDVVDLGERGLARCLTRWTNLGAGLHPTDPKWRSRYEFHSLYFDKWPELRVPYTAHSLGSIRSSFENQTSLPLKDLTARNLYSLFSKKGKDKLVTRRADGLIWKVNDPCLPYHWRLENAE